MDNQNKPLPLAERRKNEVMARCDHVIDAYRDGISVLYGKVQAAISESEQKNIRYKIDLCKKATTRLLSLRGKTNTLELARSMQPFPLNLDGSELDSSPWLLGVKNGTVDLKTGELMPFRAKDFISKAANVEMPDIDADDPPHFLRFMADIFENDHDIIDWFKRFLGSSITGIVTDQMIPILQGEGANGKSAFLRLLSNILGTGLCGPISRELLMSAGSPKQSGAPSPELLALRNMRMCWVSEPAKMKFDSEMLKHISGGDLITARGLHKDFITFPPTHKLMVITNNPPLINAGDYATRRRVVRIPFNLRFVDEPMAPNERKKDPKVEDRIAQEMPLILSWLVRGCLEWQLMGLFPVPDKILISTESFFSEIDVLKTYIDECCIVGADYYARLDDLYRVYQTWASDSGIRPISRISLSRYLAGKFSKREGARHSIFDGVGLAED